MLCLSCLAHGARCFVVRSAALPAIIPTDSDCHCLAVDQFAAAPRDVLG